MDYWVSWTSWHEVFGICTEADFLSANFFVTGVSSNYLLEATGDLSSSYYFYCLIRVEDSILELKLIYYYEGTNVSNWPLNLFSMSLIESLFWIMILLGSLAEPRWCSF